MQNDSMSNAIVLTGIACVMAAIAGGGINIYPVTIKPILSLRRQILLAALGVGLIVAGSYETILSLLRGGDSRIRITSPARDQPVAVHEFVRGQAPHAAQQVWLIVHPRETNVCWAQGPGMVNADGTWRIMGQFGEAGIQHTNKPYEVRAIANPLLSGAMPLEAGPVPCGIEAQFYSESVDVVRM